MNTTTVTAGGLAAWAWLWMAGAVSAAADPPPFVLDLRPMGRPIAGRPKPCIPGEPTVLLRLETAGGIEVTYTQGAFPNTSVEDWAFLYKGDLEKAGWGGLRRDGWKVELSADGTRLTVLGYQEKGRPLDPVVRAGVAAADLAPGAFAPVVTGPKGNVLHLVPSADGKPAEWVPIDPD